jgi:hypothetical protein
MFPAILIYLALASLAIGLVALVVGLRGKRIDREPRCPSRRCKYALGSVIDARRASEGETFPLTCPECGHVIAHERALRIGTRKKRCWTIRLGAVLLLLGASGAGVEGYATWKNAQSITTMPLWLLLYQSRTDTVANRHAHQSEIVRRAQAGLLSDAQAERVVERILDWQRDPTIEMHVLADALAPLHDQGRVTREEIEEFWRQIRLFELRVREPAAPGEILPLEVRVHFRGAENSNAPLRRDSYGNGADRSFVFHLLTIEVDELRLGGERVALHDQQRKMLFQLGPRPGQWQRDFAWRAHMDDVWDRIKLPESTTGTSDVELRLRWNVSIPSANGYVPDTFRRFEEGLVAANLPTSGAVELLQRVRVASESAPQRVVDDAIARQWLEDKMRRATLSLEIDAIEAGRFSILRFPRFRWDQPLPASRAFLMGDFVLRRDGHEFGPLPLEAMTGADLHPNAMPASIATEMIDLVERNPDGWELVFIPRPERAATRVDNIEVLGGDPIVVPITINIAQPDPENPVNLNAPYR